MARKDRRQRLEQRVSGAWGTISSDLAYLAKKLYGLSRAEAASSKDGNNSMFVYAGIPILVAALRSFIIEYESIGILTPPPPEVSSDDLVGLLRSRYGCNDGLLNDVQLLCEIRNEIVHPVPLPPGTPDNWPTYLHRIKEQGLLSSTGNPSGDYIMFGQMASQRLFTWAVKVTRSAFEAVANSDPTRAQNFSGFVESFDTFFR